MRQPGGAPKTAHATLAAAIGLAAAAGVSAPQGARADGVFTGKVSLTGFYYTESDGIPLTEDTSGDDLKLKTATNSNLGFGELRAIADGRRFARERLDFRIDLRLRMTGSFDFNRKFDHETESVGALYADNLGPSLGTSARGYIGGREYDLREAYLVFRATPTLHIQFGRMFVSEADTLKLDGVRVARQFSKHWEGSIFAGGYPNPYSRSVLSDYEPPCGAGVAGALGGTPQGPCETQGPKLGLAGGVGTRYTYDTLWGSIGVVGSFFMGPGDGGAVRVNDANATNMTPFENLLPSDSGLDKPRVYVSWLNAWRPAERVDLFSDIVVDLYGSAGPQLTRAVLLGTFRLLRDDRLTLRLGYSHLSSLAINMYLSRMVYNRQSGATLGSGVALVENNLTVLRTGREEGRVTLDTKIVRRLGAFLEGRFRYRSLINGDSNDAVYTNKDTREGYTDNVQNLAGDVTLGLRDTGSLKAIRAGLSYSAIFDFRANNHVINFDIGRDFWNERIGFTFNYVAAITADKVKLDPGGTLPTCSASPTEVFASCFGKRSGSTHEVGVLFSANPFRTLFFILDYRFIAMLTDTQNYTDPITPPPVLSHSILLRSEYRW